MSVDRLGDSDYVTVYGKRHKLKSVSGRVFAILSANESLTLKEVYDIVTKYFPNATFSAAQRAYYRYFEEKRKMIKNLANGQNPLPQSNPKKKQSKSKKTNRTKKQQKQPQIDLDDDDIPDDLRKVIKYTIVARSVVDSWKPMDTINFLKSRNAFSEPAKRIITYTRPDFFTSTQHEIIDAIQLGSLAVEGDRQTGKTTAIYAGICEDMIIHKSDWHFICSNGRNASNIFKKVVNDPLMQYLKEYYAIVPTATKMSLFNNDGTTSTFTVHNTTVSDVKGSTGNLWIDEVDQVIKDNPEVIAAAVALTRSNPNLKLVFSMNKGKGAYRLLLDVLKKYEAKGKLQFITLTKDKSFIVENDDGDDLNDDFIADIMEVTMGEDYVKSQLLNEDTSDGDAFDPQSLTDALETYPLFTTQLPSVYYTFLSIDPSGTGHPVGWFLGGYNPHAEELWEIDSGEFRLGDSREDGSRWSIQRMYEFFKRMAIDYKCKTVTCESNSGGQSLVIFLRQNGIRAITQNFGAKTTSTSHAAFIKLARMQFDERKIYLKSKKLVNELLIYAPDKKQEQYKGDVADAFLHCVWVAYGGVRYIQRKYKSNQIDIIGG